MKARSVLSLVAFTLALNPAAHADPPAAARVIGEKAFVPMQAKQLASPKAVYLNKKLMDERGLDLQKIIEMTAYAAPVSGETEGGYTDKTKTVYADGYGGIGLNGNDGNGRTFTVDTYWENKGGGITPFVNTGSDVTHRNGASLLPEGIHEAIWSNLLSEELPHGAFRILAILSTGTRVGGPDGEPRVIIVREAPVRPAHFVINPNAQAEPAKDADAKTIENLKSRNARDKARMADAMNHIVGALPQPSHVFARTESARFRLGIIEMIDRQAQMHGYAWAHSLFHGGTSPSNAGLDGRAIDFGTFQAFDGYQKIQVLHDDGASGVTDVYKTDLLQNVRDSLVKTLPPKLLRVLPTQEEWNQRFDQTFLRTQQTEMLRLAGAFNEFAPDLMNTREGLELSKLLMKIAKAGNEKVIEKYELEAFTEEYFNQGTYKLGSVLAAIAKIDLDSPVDNARLAQVLPDGALRAQLVELYTSTFRTQRKMAADLGITAKAELDYRRLATKIRNAKMTSLFATVSNEEKIWDVNAEFKEKGDTGTIQKLIDQTISDSRRDFHDAKPFTLVLNEKFVNGKFERTVFDALIDRVSKTGDPKEELKKRIRGGSCKDLFPVAI